MAATVVCLRRLPERWQTTVAVLTLARMPWPKSSPRETSLWWIGREAEPMGGSQFRCTVFWPGTSGAWQKPATARQPAMRYALAAVVGPRAAANGSRR